MAGQINDFRASFKSDLAKPSRFDVSIAIPLTLLPFIKSAQNLKYRCEATNLPGRTLATTEQKVGSYPVEKYPYMTTYNDIDLTFIVDEDMQQRTFFDGWLNLINPQFNYNFGYKGDYATTITINQYNSMGDLTYSVDLLDAYPVSMNQLDLDWSAGDSNHKLTVTFAYTQWRNNSLEALGMDFVQAGIGAITNAAGGLGGAGSSGSVIDTVASDISNFNIKNLF